MGNTDETNCQFQLHIHQIQSSLWHLEETNDTFSAGYKWDSFAGCFSPFISQWQTTFCPTQTPDYSPHNLLFWMCLHAFFSWLSYPPPLLFVSLAQPLSAPVLGARPGFRQGSVCSQLWQPAMLLFLAPSPTILETSQLFALLPYNPSPSPKGQQTDPPGPDRNTLKLLDPHISRKGEALSVSGNKVEMEPRWAATA